MIACLSCVQSYFPVLRKAIISLSEAFSHAIDNSVATGTYIWSILQFNRVIGDFTSQNWRVSIHCWIYKHTSI